MSASFVPHIICFIAVLSGGYTQLYNPYAQYGYQYYPNQGPVYTPYPYQAYVSNPYVLPSYLNYAPPSYNYYGYPYPGQQAYPYPYTYPQYTPPQTYPSTTATYDTNPAPRNQSQGEDPYANIKVDIIDVEPKNFPYYKNLFGLEDNPYPVRVIDDASVSSNGQQQPQIQPRFTVKTESTSYNYTTAPKGVSIHDVKSKSYSFKRTFTLDPRKKENAVINLNFVNGVQVTTTETPQADSNREEEKGEEEERAVTEESAQTTTESEEVEGLSSWFK